MKQRKVILPHEHGGWAMVSVPFILGMFAGEPGWIHYPLFLAWLLFYLASYPLLQSLKNKGRRQQLIPWGLGYGITGLICVAIPLMHTPELFYIAPLMLVLLSINIWHVLHRKERSIMNDLSAMLLFSIGAAAAYWTGGGDLDRTMAAVVGFSFLHFAGSAFFVKTVFRERGNVRWTAISRIYHIILLIIPWMMSYPWMMIAYLYSSARAFVFSGKSMPAWKAGVIEIMGAAQFVVISSLML